MSQANITRTEAAARAAALRVHAYEVDLDLSGGAQMFRSRTTVRFHADTDTTWLDLIAPAVRAITVNGQPRALSDHDGARIVLTGLRHGENTVVVDADCAYMRTGEGLHRFVDPVDDEVYLYTQFESADARRMYAAFEQPDLKATFQLSVTAPAHWQVVSNSPSPQPQPAGDGVARWDFAPTERVSTYITALVAGPYHHVHDRYDGPHGSYPLGVYCRRSLAEHLDADEILTVTKQGFELFERLFGVAYPFAKYDQLFVPEFNSGAMENAGCVTFLEDYVFRSRVTMSAYESRANTILHELAHMWFGNLVTMRWWDDLWLNESFAEWAAHFASVAATRYTDAWTSFAVVRKNWAYRQDQLPSTHPIALDMVDLEAVRVNFDGITYAKGASALKQLVAWVGEEQFLAGLRSYFAEYAWQNTQLPDLLRHLEAAGGRELGRWTEQWLRTAGVNLLRPHLEVRDGVIQSLVIEQEPPSTPPGLDPVLRDHRLGVGLYVEREGQLVRSRLLDVDVTGARTEVPQLAGEPMPDLLLLNDGDYTFAKIRLDEHSARTAITGIGRIEDPLARTLIWSAAWDMTRDAEMSCGAYLALVGSGLAVEPDVSVVQAILRQARLAIDFYAAPANRDDYGERLATMLWDATEAAQPGSDHQLAFLRGFAANAAGAGDLAKLSGLLDGSVTIPGVDVDTDLRWLFVEHLAAAGVIDAAAIDAELARDATATGRRRHALALAARPTAAAKEAAWAAIVAGDLPNTLIDANLLGFMRPGQEPLLEPYRDRYFDELATVWAERTGETAQTITALLYPAPLVDDATVAGADAVLARADLPSTALRLVAEGRDATLRAMRARDADAG